MLVRNRDTIPVIGERQEYPGLAGEYDEGHPCMWAETHQHQNTRTTQPQNNKRATIMGVPLNQRVYLIWQIIGLDFNQSVNQNLETM